MARVMTFSREFPAYHPKAGKPTHFVQKILHSLLPKGYKPFTEIGNPAKFHTIRAGNRWKVGDTFSPRVWSGKPYRSKMITIAPDIEVKKVWDFEIKDNLFFLNGKVIGITKILDITENDGLSCFIGLLEWLKYPNPFKGQIICWNENINY